MIFDTYNSEAVIILTESPNWQSPVRADIDFVAQVSGALTGRESRRGFGGALRWKLKFTSMLSGADSLALAGGLRDYLSQPVLVPFWPGALAWSDRASTPWDAGFKIAFKSDWSQWEVFTTTTPSWPASTDLWAPLLYGRLENRDIQQTDVDVSVFAVEFVETGPVDYALTPGVETWTSGPTPTGYGAAPKRFPFALEWSGEPVESASVNIQRDGVGFRRDAIEHNYAAQPTRNLELGVTLTSADDIARAARWFLDYAPGGSFWTPNTVPCATLAADIAGAATTFTVDDDTGIKVGDYLALCSVGEIVQTCKVSGVASNTITVTAALSAADSDTITVHQLILARLEKPKLQLSFDEPGLLSTSFVVVEVPSEVVVAADETVATTIGGLPTRCYLYEFSQSIGGSTYYERLTSFEDDLTYSANTFTSSHISHGNIRRGVAIDRDAVQITAKFDAATMLGKLVTMKSELPVMLTIYQGDASGGAASNVTTLYVGEVTKPALRGKIVTASTISGGSMFDRKLPRFFLQPGCNHALFSTGCGLVDTDWKFSAVVAATITAGYPYMVSLSTLARVTGATPTFFDDWFAGGWVEYGSGASTQRRAIMHSVQLTATTLEIYLRRDFDTVPASGATVYLYPGCDGRMETCKAYAATTNAEGKFNNFVNFGGHPFVPSQNPSLLKVSKNLAGGKK